MKHCLITEVRAMLECSCCLKSGGHEAMHQIQTASLKALMRTARATLRFESLTRHISEFFCRLAGG